MMEEKKKKIRFVPVLAAVVAVIVIVFLVWISVEHRLIPAGAEDVTIFAIDNAKETDDPYESRHRPGRTLLDGKYYALAEEGQQKLLDQLDGFTMKLSLGGEDETVSFQGKELMIGVRFTLNGKDCARYVFLNDPVEVIFPSGSMGFPGDLFIGLVNTGRLKNVSAGDLYDFVKALCGEYGTFVKDK